MKKFLRALIVVLAVVVMATLFTACGDKSGAIRRAFEKEEYEVTVVNGADSEELKDWLSEDKVDEIGKYDDIVENLGQEAYDEAVESGFVNGNCFLISISPDAVEIFKNA